MPQGWHELSDKQLRYVYQLLAQNFTSDEVKTLCLLHWTGTKVIGKQNGDGYLLRKGKFLFEVTPLTLAELLPNLDWLGALSPTPIRPIKLKHRPGIAADFAEVPFEQYIIVDNLYQDYLQTQSDDLLDELASVLCPGIKPPLTPDERIAIFYWVSRSNTISLAVILTFPTCRVSCQRQLARLALPVGRGCNERTNPCPHQRRRYQRSRSPRPRHALRIDRVKRTGA